MLILHTVTALRAIATSKLLDFHPNLLHISKSLPPRKVRTSSPLLHLHDTTAHMTFLTSRAKFHRLYRKQRHFFRRSRLQIVFVFSLFLLIFELIHRLRPFPPDIPVSPTSLTIPSAHQSFLSYAHTHAASHNLPVFVLYKARSGQLNNQLISFFNALTLAKRANATLIAPFAFYGSESYIDYATGRSIFFHIAARLDLWIHQPLRKRLGLFFQHDDLVGDYFDGELLNETQPVVSSIQFLESPGVRHLQSFQAVLARHGDAAYYYMALGRRRFFGRNVNMRRIVTGPLSTTGAVASRKQLDCNFNISHYFSGLNHHAGVNGNFLFLSKLYRSHSLNCTSKDPYWLDVRRYVQPRVEIRALIHDALRKWGDVLAVHLRLFPFDDGKFSVTKFINHFLQTANHQHVDYIYIAHSVSSKPSLQIIKLLRQHFGNDKILTASDFGNLESRGVAFQKRYSLPLVDMWTCVQSAHFFGRLGSSLSWNVVYWRQAFGVERHSFYSLSDFSLDGQHNPTDSYGY